MLPQLWDDQLVDENLNNIDVDNEDEAILRTFVPLLPPTHREDIVINDALDRMQSNNPPLMWPEIDGIPISEFWTASYMVRAFPTLYPHSQADLHSERARDVSRPSISNICCDTKMEDLHSTQDEGISH